MSLFSLISRTLPVVHRARAMVAADTQPAAPRRRAINERRTHIRQMRTDAVAALHTATHETMQQQVSIAVHDLDEASCSIARDDKTPQDSKLAIADLAIVLAATRLAKIDISLALDGPDAQVSAQL